MKKTIFVIEKQDNHGEFQPLDTASFKHRQEAIDAMEGKKQIRVSLAYTHRYRVMPYVRQEVIS